jgi:hypothetical protein
MSGDILTDGKVQESEVTCNIHLDQVSTKRNKIPSPHTTAHPVNTGELASMISRVSKAALPHNAQRRNIQNAPHCFQLIKLKTINISNF